MGENSDSLWHLSYNLFSLLRSQLRMMEDPLYVEVAKKMELTHLQFQFRAAVPSREGQATGSAHWPQPHITEANFQVNIGERSVTPSQPSPTDGVEAWPAENNEAPINNTPACS